MKYKKTVGALAIATSLVLPASAQARSVPLRVEIPRTCVDAQGTLNVYYNIYRGRTAVQDRGHVQEVDLFGVNGRLGPKGQWVVVTSTSGGEHVRRVSYTARYAVLASKVRVKYDDSHTSFYSQETAYTGSSCE